MDLQQSVLQLQAEVAQLRQEMTQMRAAMGDANANPGVGGSGLAGTSPSDAQTNPPVRQDTVADGTTATQGTATQGTAPRGTTAQGTTDPGQAVVNAIYTGTVHSVSGRRLELLDEDGQPFTMELGERTTVLRNGQRISAQQLKQGTRVRVIVDLLSPRNQLMEITTLPAR